MNKLGLFLLLILTIGVFLWTLIVQDNLDSVQVLNQGQKYQQQEIKTQAYGVEINRREMQKAKKAVGFSYLKLLQAESRILELKNALEIPNYQNSVFYVKIVDVYNSDIILSSGSCFLLDKEQGIFVTAAHVIDGIFLAGQQYNINIFVVINDVEIKALDSIFLNRNEFDIGLILLDPKVIAEFSIKEIPIANEEPKYGERMIYVGYPYGWYNSLPFAVSGHFIGDFQEDLHSDCLHEKYKQTYYWFKGDAIQGMSGGAILNVHGELISLLSRSDGNASFGINLPALKESLEMLVEDILND